MENKILRINYEVNVKEFRKLWFEMFKRGIPSILAFWGIIALISLLGFCFTEFKPLFLNIFLFCLAIQITSSLMNYQAFMKNADQQFMLLSKEERQIELSFDRTASGFNCRNGKNYSYIDWESIKGVEEFENSIVFNTAGNAFQIPKSAFQSNSDIEFLKILVKANVSQNVKLLN